MSGKARYDWEYWKFKYVSGDDSVTLEALSRSPNAPGLRAFKTRSTKESWTEQRKAFRHQTIAKVADNATTQQSVQQTQKLVDAAEIITSHVQIARAMKSIAAKRLRTIDPDELSPKDLAMWVKMVADMERLAIGLSTEKAEIDVQVNLNALSDAQLERIAQGEELQSVLN